MRPALFEITRIFPERREFEICCRLHAANPEKGTNLDSTQFFPDLETKRLYMRRLSVTDTDFLLQHFSNSQVTQYLMDNPPLTDRLGAEEIVAFYNNPNQATCNRWGLVLKKDQRLIGTCGYHRWEKRYFRAEIGYDLSPDVWRQGFMSEALRAALDHGFESMNLNRVDASIYVKNERSVQLLERLGFRNEGTLRDYFYQDGQFYDHYVFSLLKREWKSQ